MTRHDELVREILRAANRVPGVFLFPVAVVRAPGWGRTRGMKGTPDLLGWCAEPLIGIPRFGIPRFVAIEVKVKPDTPTREQQAFLDMLREAGGIGLVAYDVLSVMEALR